MNFSIYRSRLIRIQKKVFEMYQNLKKVINFKNSRQFFQRVKKMNLFSENKSYIPDSLIQNKGSKIYRIFCTLVCKDLILQNRTNDCSLKISEISKYYLTS